MPFMDYFKGCKTINQFIQFIQKFFICFNGSPSKMMENAFYFILKALFVLKIFKFFS